MTEEEKSGAADAAQGAADAAEAAENAGEVKESDVGTGDKLQDGAVDETEGEQLNG